jgi:hypothetical protein
VQVRRPAQEVFAYLADVRNEVHWRESVVESGYQDDAALSVGTRGRTGVEMGDKRVAMGWTVVEHEPGRHVRWELTEGPWRGGGSYTVEPVEDGAAVTAALEVRLAGPARLLEPVLGVMLGRGLHRDLERLRTVLSSTSPEHG